MCIAFKDNFSFIVYFGDWQFLNSCWSTHVGQCREMMLRSLLRTSELGLAWGLSKHNATMSRFTPASWLFLPNPIKQLHLTSHMHWIHVTQDSQTILPLKYPPCPSTRAWSSWPTSFAPVFSDVWLWTDWGLDSRDYSVWTLLHFDSVLVPYHELTDEDAGIQSVS